MGEMIGAAPQGRKLQEALAKARKMQAEGAGKEALEGVLGEIRSAQAEWDKYVGEREAKQNGDVGDELRKELDSAERHDRRTNKMVYDTDGAEVSPTAATLLRDAPRICNIPAEVASHPMARAIHMPTNDENLKALQQLHDEMILVRAHSPKKSWRELPHARKLWNDSVELMVKANVLNPDVSGYGAEWVPVFYSNQMIEDMYIEARVTNLFPRFPMPRQQCVVPRMLTRPAVYRQTGATTIGDFWSPSSPVSELPTSNITFTADRLQCIIGWEDETEEEVLIAIGPEARRVTIESVRSAVEDAIINGSVSTTDLDNAGTALWGSSTGVQDHRYAWNGLRKDALVTSTTSVSAGGTGAFDIDVIIQCKAAMGKYGTDIARDRCAWIVGVDAEAMLLGLTELITVDKYGASATVLRGEIGQLFGMPVVVSGNVYGPYHGTGLNASGVYDGSTTTCSTMMLVNRDAYWLGDRREIRVEPDRSVIGGVVVIVVSGRWDFQKVLASTAPTCSVIYNLLP